MDDSTSSAKLMRLMIIGTPRSGNTWLRHLLAKIYGIPERAVHALSDEEWPRLPPECVLQVHWRREHEFAARLQEHGFRAVTVARHPFDTLLSILHVAVHDIQSEHWLQGEGGTERVLWGAMPRSRSFLDYACGPRAAALFDVTWDWWQAPDVARVRYEDLVADPIGELNRLTETLGPPRHDLPSAIESTSLDKMKKTAVNCHFWQGRPGLWRELLPRTEAAELALALREPLDRYGYACDPDPDLSPSQADANWVRYVGEELGQALRRNTQGHIAQIQEVHAASKQFEAEMHQWRDQSLTMQRERDEHSTYLVALLNEHGKLHADFLAANAERDAQRAQADFAYAALAAREAELAATQRELTALQAHAAQFAGLSGTALRAARKVQAMRNRFPGTAAFLKRSIRRAG